MWHTVLTFLMLWQIACKMIKIIPSPHLYLYLGYSPLPRGLWAWHMTIFGKCASSTREAGRGLSTWTLLSCFTWSRAPGEWREDFSVGSVVTNLLPMQDTGSILAWEDHTYCGTAKPMCHNSWVRVTTPELASELLSLCHNSWPSVRTPEPGSQLPSPLQLGAQALQQEEATSVRSPAPPPSVGPAHCTRRAHAALKSQQNQNNK